MGILKPIFTLAPFNAKEESMSEVTEILRAIKDGQEQGAEQLLALVYAELKRIAAQKMAGEASGHTLQPTALVHEAWIRLVGDGDAHFENKAHFFSAAAEAMRRILVESARRKNAAKRGSGSVKVELEEYHLVQEAPPEELFAVDEALDLLAKVDPSAAEFVKLRYFVGMNREEAAETMGLSSRSADRIWAYARAWLKRQIRRQNSTAERI